MDLSSTQRYIVSITEHKSVPHSKLLVPRHEPPSPKTTQPAPNSILLPVFAQTFSHSVPSHRYTQSKPQLHSSPRALQVLSLHLAGETGENFVVNRYLRPKRLVGVRRKEQGHERVGSDVELYLRRFEHSEEPKESIRSRRGVSGWKLSAVRSSRNKALDLLATNKSSQLL